MISSPPTSPACSVYNSIQRAGIHPHPTQAGGWLVVMRMLKSDLLLGALALTSPVNELSSFLKCNHSEIILL